MSRRLLPWVGSIVVCSAVALSAQAESPSDDDAAESPMRDNARDAAQADGAAPANGAADDAAPAHDAARPDDATEADERAEHEQRDRAAAESLLKVGQELLTAGQLEPACNNLSASVDAYFIGDAALLLAECQERRGLLASAWASYRLAAARLRKLGDPRAVEALARSEALEPRVPRLTITTSSTLRGLTILRGRTRFDDGVLGVALAVDPGSHRIEARADGHVPWAVELTLKAGDHRTIHIPELTRTTRAPSPTSDSEHGGWWTAGWITGATGLVTVATGALLGGLAAADVAAARSDEALCGSDQRCTPGGLARIERADRFAISSTVLLSVGGAATLGGIAMLLFDQPHPAEAVGLRVSPRLSVSELGISLTGEF